MRVYVSTDEALAPTFSMDIDESIEDFPSDEFLQAFWREMRGVGKSIDMDTYEVFVDRHLAPKTVKLRKLGENDVIIRRKEVRRVLVPLNVRFVSALEAVPYMSTTVNVPSTATRDDILKALKLENYGLSRGDFRVINMGVEVTPEDRIPIVHGTMVWVGRVRSDAEIARLNLQDRLYFETVSRELEPVLSKLKMSSQNFEASVESVMRGSPGGPFNIQTLADKYLTTALEAVPKLVEVASRLERMKPN